MIPNDNGNEKNFAETNTFINVFKSISTKIKTRVNDMKVNNITTGNLPITKEIRDHEINEFYFKEEKKITTGLGEKKAIFFSEEIKVFTEVETSLNQKINCLSEDEEIMTNFEESFIETRQKAYLPDEEGLQTFLSSSNSNKKDNVPALDNIAFTDDVIFHTIIYVLIAVLFVYLLIFCAMKIIKFTKNESRKEKIKWRYEVVDSDDYE